MPNEHQIFADALAIESRSERDRFLDQACTDRAMRARIDADLNRAFYQPPGDEPGENGERSADADFELEAPTTDRNDTILVSEKIGPYRLREKIGEGGFGVVYLAEQTEPVRRRAALKLIKPGMDSREIIARFEAELGAQVSAEGYDAIEPRFAAPLIVPA